MVKYSRFLQQCHQDYRGDRPPISPGVSPMISRGESCPPPPVQVDFTYDQTLSPEMPATLSHLVVLDPPPAVQVFHQ